MKSAGIMSVVMLAVAALLALSGTAQATSLYWDINGATANDAGSGSGTWDGANLWWNTASSGTGGTPQAGTTSADDLFFSSGSNYTDATVTLSGTRAASSIQFEDNIAQSLTGGTSLTVGGTGTSSGVFVLSGDNANNSISTPLILGAASTIQTAGAGVLAISGWITGTKNLTLKNNSTNAAGITLSAGSVNNTGTITNSGTGTGGVTISSVIGTNVTTVTQNSTTSALTLSGGANLYTGTTYVTAGTLSIGATGSLAGQLYVNGGTFDLKGHNETVAGLVTLYPSGSIIDSVGGGTLTGTYTAGVGYSYNVAGGTISAVLGGTGWLNESTNATVTTLTGLNTYTGKTNISAGGKLIVSILADGGQPSSIGQSSNDAANLTFGGGGSGNGAILQYTGGTVSIDRNFIIVSGGLVRIDVANAGTNLTISGASTSTTGILYKDGAGTLILSGNNLYTGATYVTAGTLTAANNGALGTAAGATSITSGATAAIQGSGLNIAEPITLNGTGVSSLGALRNMANTNTWSGAITLGTASTIGVDAGTLILGSSAMSGAYALTKVGGGTLQLGAASQIPSGASLTVNGGTLDLHNFAQSMATTLTLTDGTISSGGSSGTLTAATYAVCNGRIDADTYGGASGLTKTTTGTVVLSGSHCYSGTTTISGGVLQGTEGTNIPTNTIMIFNANNAAAVLQTSAGSFARTVGAAAGNVQWSGTNASGGFAAVTNDLTVSLGGLGTPTPLTWAASDTFAGLLSFGSATADKMVDFQNPISLGTAARTVQVDDNPGVATDYAKLSGQITSGAGGGLTKTGAGLLELSAENTYSGGTTVSAGTLKVSGTIGAVLVKAGAKLTGDGQVGSVTVGELGGDPGAIVAPGNSPGTLDVGGDYTMNNGSIYEWELASLLSYDKIAVTGDLTLNSTWTLKIINDGFVPGYISPSEQFNLFTYVGSLSSTFDTGDDHKLISVNIVIGSGLDPDIWNIGDAEVRYDTSGPAKRVYLTGLQVGSGGGGAVPEPAALGLIGLALLAVRRRKA